MLKNRIEMRDHSAEGRLFFRRTLVAYIGMVALTAWLQFALYPAMARLALLAESQPETAQRSTE